MTEFLFILTNVMLPIAIIVLIGYTAQLKLNLDRPTLGKLMINYIIPGFIFMNLYKSNIDFTLLLYIMVFLFIFALISYAASVIIAKISGVKGQHTVLFTNSSLFYNAGNYGVPVNDLVFKSDPFAMSVQVMMVVFQNIIAYSYGIFVLSAENTGKFKALLGYFKMPIFYGLFLGLLFNYFNVGLPAPVISSLDYIREAMIGMVLFILGTQIAGIRFRHLRVTAFIATVVKLLIIPALALPLLLLFNVDGVVAQAILITTAMPASVNSSVIAQQYSSDPEYAAEIVMMSTLLSAVTLPFVIYTALAVF
ncbi:Membrane transport protein [Jeotgalicoccus saudimassiliensis]|uniref:Membrane transport protein n=1 Tax=Jeotgalicoccus saudimassiliensis TaxID=1461582 RepID=A0A078M4R6_9STAP|nr:AEC family transporter [Jeotgalicoccus saudimassiliensis]CEA01320.1 Membrane transport protein [Jeotgalicoccus saudimassiliensis]